MRLWLRNAREQAGFTMKKLAEMLHVSESYYCAIENGSRQKNMDITLAQRISLALGIPLKHIVSEEEKLRGCTGLEKGTECVQ